MLLVAALVFAARPRLAVVGLGAVQRADTALAAHFVPRYESRLAHLQAENAALHTRLADAQGRFAGRITAAGADRCTLTFAEYLSPAAAGFTGAQAGLLQRGWRLTGLALPCDLPPGTAAVTADGLWLGTVTGTPAPAADGLSAEVTLCGTADLAASVFFIKM